MQLFKVEFSGANSSSPALALRCEWFDGQNTVLRLTQLRMALQHRRLSLLVLSIGGLHLRLCQRQLRACLMYSLLPGCNRCTGLIHLIDGDELLRQQRLDAMKVIRLIEQFGRSAAENRLCVCDIRLRLLTAAAARSTLAAAPVVFAFAAPTALTCEATVLAGR